MTVRTEVARPDGHAPWLDVRLAARDMTRIGTIAATLRKSSRPRPLVLAGRDAAATANAIASALQLNLLRVDLSAVMSKYIGETEKNLARLFAVAEARAAILVLDEADALFGKRTDVKDAHDRYSNAEINSLLCGLARHRGVVIFISKVRTTIPIRLRRHFSFYHFPPIVSR